MESSSIKHKKVSTNVSHTQESVSSTKAFKPAVIGDVSRYTSEAPSPTATESKSTFSGQTSSQSFSQSSEKHSSTQVSSSRQDAVQSSVSESMDSATNEF